MRRSAPLLIAAAVAAVASAYSAPPALGGTVRGELHLPPSQAARTHANAYPGSAASMPGSHMPELGRPVDAVVYLEGPPEGAGVPASGPVVPRLSQKDQRFVPRVVAVMRGGSVDFPNLDPIFHNVFSVSPTRRFDLGKYPRPKSKQVVFPRTGLVKVYCDIHSDMEAFILVLPNHCFAQPDASGAFRIDNVPAGTWRLKVWHPDLSEMSRDITVPDSGEVHVEVPEP